MSDASTPSLPAGSQRLGMNLARSEKFLGPPGFLVPRSPTKGHEGSFRSHELSAPTSRSSTPDITKAVEQAMGANRSSTTAKSGTPTAGETNESSPQPEAPPTAHTAADSLAVQATIVTAVPPKKANKMNYESLDKKRKADLIGMAKSRGLTASGKKSKEALIRSILQYEVDQGNIQSTEQDSHTPAATSSAANSEPDDEILTSLPSAEASVPTASALEDGNNHRNTQAADQEFHTPAPSLPAAVKPEEPTNTNDHGGIQATEQEFHTPEPPLPTIVKTEETTVSPSDDAPAPKHQQPSNPPSDELASPSLPEEAMERHQEIVEGHEGGAGGDEGMDRSVSMAVKSHEVAAAGDETVVSRVAEVKVEKVEPYKVGDFVRTDCHSREPKKDGDDKFSLSDLPWGKIGLAVAGVGLLVYAAKRYFK